MYHTTQQYAVKYASHICSQHNIYLFHLVIPFPTYFPSTFILLPTSIYICNTSKNVLMRENHFCVSLLPLMRLPFHFALKIVLSLHFVKKSHFLSLHFPHFLRCNLLPYLGIHNQISRQSADL